MKVNSEYIIGAVGLALSLVIITLLAGIGMYFDNKNPKTDDEKKKKHTALLMIIIPLVILVLYRWWKYSFGPKDV